MQYTHSCLMWEVILEVTKERKNKEWRKQGRRKDRYRTIRGAGRSCFHRVLGLLKIPRCIKGYNKSAKPEKKSLAPPSEGLPISSLSFAPSYCICMLLALASFVRHTHNYFSGISLRVQCETQTSNGKGSWQWQCLLGELLRDLKATILLPPGEAKEWSYEDVWGRH